ncbi:MAG: 2Fe-2S iron-sulfur cluster-binding protein, partial [Ilumatobacteraceae bacterium]
QSGYSAGAMVLGTLALLEKNPAPTDAQIRDMLSGILDRETAYVKPVEAIHRAAAVLRGEETEAFAPLIVPPLTQQGEPADYDPSDAAPTASPAVPRVIPSRDVPDMAVVGKPEIKVDAIRLAKGNSPMTSSCGTCCSQRCCAVLMRTLELPTLMIPLPGHCQEFTRFSTTKTHLV